MSYHPDLVAEIEAFCAGHEMSEITFGRQALKDPHFVRDVRATRRLFRQTEDKVRAFMRTHSLDAGSPSSGDPDDNASPRAPSRGTAEEISPALRQAQDARGEAA